MIVDDIGELKSSDCFIETMGCVLPFFTGRDIDFFFLVSLLLYTFVSDRLEQVNFPLKSPKLIYT